MLALRGAAFRTTGIILAILLCTYCALLLTVNSARFQDWLKTTLAAQTGYEVVGELQLDPLLRINLNQVSVSKAAKPVLQAHRISMIISPLALFSKSIHRLRLEKPVLYLELDDLMKSSKEAASDITIRHLNIADGTLVLNVGSGHSLDFRSLAMNAENVNVGEAAGLNLRADIPWLKGIAEVVVTSGEHDAFAKLRVEQTPNKASGNLLKPKPRGTEALEAEIKLDKKEDESLGITVQGKLNALVIGEENFSGHFDARADFGTNREQAGIAAKIVATELPAQMRFLPIAPPKGTSTLVLEGHLSVPDKRLDVRSLRLQSPLGEAAAMGQVDFVPQVTFSNGTVTLRRVTLEPLKPLLPSPINALASGGLLDADLQLRGPWGALAVLGTIQGSGIQLRNHQFSLAALSFKTPVAWAHSSFRAADVQISGKKLLARQASEMPVSAEDLRINGTWEQKLNEPMKVAGEIRINQGRFASLDGTRVGENLTLGGRFETTSRRDPKETAIAGKLDIEQGEMLWGTFFGDLKSQKPSLQFDGDYLADADALRVRELNFSLASIGKIAARGDIEQASKNPLLRLEINSDVQPAGFFEFFIRNTLNRSFPVLNQLAVGGRLGFAVKANGSLENLSLEGTMQLRAGEVQEKSKRWQVGPLQLDLPFRIQYPAASLPATPSNVPVGSLTIASARIGSETISVTKTPLSLWNNELRIRQAIRLPIYGGVVEISDLAFRDVIQDPQALSLSLQAKDLQLQRLTEALGWPRFGGTLSGSIPKIEWGSGSLRSEGKIQVAVFGGRVQISKLEVESPFSAVPSIKLDALFRDISLEQASKTFAFGQISGILEGTVNEFVMTAGQPSEFRADVRSVEKRGVSQSISVESLNKITVLSSGNDTGALYGGIASLFDSFRYSKLGFKATLKNDKLTLRGVESRKDGEYLVVASLIPPAVNVVSHTQTIAFSELLRRLERIQKSEKADDPAN